MIKIDQLKPGDLVCVIDEDLCGNFAFAKAKQITFICEHGFEHTRPASQLILSGDFEFETPIQDQSTEPASSPKGLTNIDEMVVDLHLHEVVSHTSNMTNHEKVVAQLDRAKSALEEAESKRIKKVILIHGVGKGKLKKELHHFLNGKTSINYHDADYKRFGYGATEVVFYKFS
ncbi:hypothetical protein BST97_04635 [Nonlabens spongiae]|uniref:Smr domain-containing protein n=1 Tax=Nonlabens spongiae TaxID=331648 RepID=A0A1W6MI99_9FLAO|nr:Smr/MutS family protein [Nonlabens spongiae]ARN77325.1 hypothetical protein BST97_04635 [Nonlabens spongiae]